MEQKQTLNYSNCEHLKWTWHPGEDVSDSLPGTIGFCAPDHQGNQIVQSTQKELQNKHTAK